MEFIRKNRILEVHPDTLEVVRKEHGLNEPGAMKASIDELEEWVKKQKHFKKKDFTRHYLESVVIGNKGSLERAKSRMENSCVMRTTMPQFFGNYHIRDDFKELEGMLWQALLPKLTKDHSRAYLVKGTGNKFPSNIYTSGARILFMFCEYLKAHDYNDGYIMISDYRECNMFRIASKLSIFEFRKIAYISMEGYGARVKGIHILTSSFFVFILVTIFKAVLSSKISSRIYVHKDLESLHKVVDKDILPVEYGGKERSLDILHEEWCDELSSEEFRAFQRDINSAGVDETLRETK